MTRFLAIPPYTPGHPFKGRKPELQLLDDWALSPINPILVLEAVGGMGKSMLCWQWVNGLKVRDHSFKGILWYSFYERGADMNDFCAQALSFLTGSPIDICLQRKTADLAREIVFLLKQNSYLLILDGLERVLRAYNRFDASQIRDDQLSAPGESSKKNAEECIRPADSSFLHALTGAGPSKMLISSRLMPSVLQRNGTEIVGVRCERLTGLAPEDAESMLREMNVRGDSLRMRQFLKKYVECHPLMVGVVGGLVKYNSSAPEDFDHWLSSQVATIFATSDSVDVVQSRNRILEAAFSALDPKACSLLASVGLVSEAVDSETMAALNPYRPDPPEEVFPPDEWWLEASELIEDYNHQKSAFDAYQVDLERWRSSPEFAMAEQQLHELILDLSARGLLQCDHLTKKYDLHPVVRGYAVSSIASGQKDLVGQRLIDHFSSQIDISSSEVRTLHDIRNSLQVARTLLHLQRYRKAATAIDDLESALFWSLEAWDLYLALAKSLFPDGWILKPPGINNWALVSLSNGVALALGALGKPKEAIPVGEFSLDLAIESDSEDEVLIRLRNLAFYSQMSFQFAKAIRLREIEARATSILGDTEFVALFHLDQSALFLRIGDLKAAKEHWLKFDALPRPSSRHIYRIGYGEYYFAELSWHEGSLEEASILKAEHLAREANSRAVLRAAKWLRGEWALSCANWADAADAFEEHAALTREVNLDSSWSEARLALAQLKLGQPQPFVEIADRLAGLEDPPHAALAELNLALGQNEKARKSAIAGYTEAWGEGAPYVELRTIQKCLKVLEALGDTEPILEAFDPASIKPFAFEDKLAAYLTQKLDEKLENQATSAITLEEE